MPGTSGFGVLSLGLGLLGSRVVAFWEVWGECIGSGGRQLILLS